MALIVDSKIFDEERALYNLTDAEIFRCRFEGPADGESALKEARRVAIHKCQFSLRYPLWHVQNFQMDNCSMDDKARAAIWYAEHGQITDCHLGGIKALRECSDIDIAHSTIDSPEFGWKCRDIRIRNSQLQAEYVFLDSRNVELKEVQMKGKYSFQYMEDLLIEDSYLDTKDAFWHSKNVTVRNSTVKGEYLAWFSDGLTLENCKIIGTQPLCYCKNLKLINCTMEGTDLAFEYSDVDATVIGHIDSVKNPRSGCITADSVGAIVTEDPVMECTGKVIIR